MEKPPCETEKNFGTARLLHRGQGRLLEPRRKSSVLGGDNPRWGAVRSRFRQRLLHRTTPRVRRVGGNAVDNLVHATTRASARASMRVSVALGSRAVGL